MSFNLFRLDGFMMEWYLDNLMTLSLVGAWFLVVAIIKLMMVLSWVLHDL
jgi:hypothetical protein